MGFLACPDCGNINRDTDSNCFSCKADLSSIPPPPPPVPEAEVVQEGELDARVTRIAPDKADAPRFKDLASRYENKPVPKMDASIVHGLRSGIIGGMVVGAFMGALRTQLPDDVTSLLLRHYPKMNKAGFDVWLYTFLGDIVFGLILGAILGFINQICWQPESGRTGFILGALIACFTYYLVGMGAHPASIVIGAFHGYALGWVISGVERKIFRRM